MQSPFLALKSLWSDKIDGAVNAKKRFQRDADIACQYLQGPYTFLYGQDYRSQETAFTYTGDSSPVPSWTMTVNKVAEMVQLYGPTLYHTNPVRKVTPRRHPLLPIELFGDPNDPMVQMQYLPFLQMIGQGRSVDQARAILLEKYLNYTPYALDLKKHARQAIDETLIKGAGVLWQELYVSKSGRRLVGSFYDSIDNLLLDPDVEEIETATWAARRRTRPTWQVEQEWGYPADHIRGSLESAGQQALVSNKADGSYRRKQGLTNDLLVYWEIYSKMGLGGRLYGAKDDLRELTDLLPRQCYLLICDNLNHPINLPPWLTDTGDEEAIRKAVAWPTPFWLVDNWPFQMLAFHWVPRELWPMSHLKPGLGELQFLNWAFSFLASKLKNNCKDFIAVQKAASEEIKRVLVSGHDLELIEIESAAGRTINEVVQFLQHPEIKPDFFKIVEIIEKNFERRVGLDELMYGSTRHQFRSASEAQIKEDKLAIRPDDMANKVEDWAGTCAEGEAFAARWHLDAQDVAAPLGQAGAMAWPGLISAADPLALAYGLEYRIEESSARKPNKDRDIQNMNQAMQNLFGPLLGYAQATLDFSSLNALITDWANANDLNAEKYLFKPPPMMPPMQGPGNGKPMQRTEDRGQKTENRGQRTV